MKNNKPFLLILFLTFSFYSVCFSQSFSFTYNNKQVIPDSSINVEVPINGNLNVPLIVYNNSATDIYAKVKKVEKNVIEGSVNTFCWGTTCYSPETYLSPKEILISAGGLNKSFYGDYAPYENPGTTSVLYVFFDINNPKDSSYFTINYSAKPESIDELRYYNPVSFLKIYPNPFTCNERPVISFQLNESAFINLKIFDVSGREVKTIINNKVLKGEHHINFSADNFSKGSYTCILRANNVVCSVKKLIIVK